MAIQIFELLRPRVRSDFLLSWVRWPIQLLCCFTRLDTKRFNHQTVDLFHLAPDYRPHLLPRLTMRSKFKAIWRKRAEDEFWKRWQLRIRSIGVRVQWQVSMLYFIFLRSFLLTCHCRSHPGRPHATEDQTWSLHKQTPLTVLHQDHRSLKPSHQAVHDWGLYVAIWSIDGGNRRVFIEIL